MRIPTLLLALSLASPAMAQKETLTIDVPNDVATMDPHIQSDLDSAAVYRNVFDHLVTRDTSGKFAPQLARAWRYTDDTTLVFDLRTDIGFHDGSKVTAEDVVFSVRRILDPELKSPQRGYYDLITSAEVTGPAQVTLRTRVPYPTLLAQLTHLAIVPKAYVEKMGGTAFNMQPLGTGPYKLREWRRGVQAVLEAADGNWRGAPPFRTAVFRVVPDAATRIADLRAGRADINRQMNADDAQQLTGDRQLQVISVPTERIGYLFLNQLWGPTTDLRVRRAIAMAIDRDTILATLYAGYAKPVNIMLAPISFGYAADIKFPAHDPEKARALIKEANATGAQLVFLTSPFYDRRLVEAIQQMLQEIGLKVEIRSLDNASYLRARQGTPQDAGSMAPGRWSCACQDADGTIFPLFRTGGVWAKYSNPAFDKLVDAARATLDDGKRTALYHDAFAILRDDVPAVPLFQDAAIYGARKELRWQPTPDESFLLMDMKWQQ
jgi:peptide/nickel transport system substrate-binding protein